jgi:hypothetical protein
LIERVTTKNCFIPSDLAVLVDEQDALPVLQKMIRRTGEMLGAWGELRDAAQTLNAKGDSYARVL